MTPAPRAAALAIVAAVMLLGAGLTIGATLRPRDQEPAPLLPLELTPHARPCIVRYASGPPHGDAFEIHAASSNVHVHAARPPRGVNASGAVELGNWTIAAGGVATWPFGELRGFVGFACKSTDASSPPGHWWAWIGRNATVAIAPTIDELARLVTSTTAGDRT